MRQRGRNEGETNSAERESTGQMRAERRWSEGVRECECEEERGSEREGAREGRVRVTEGGRAVEGEVSGRCVGMKSQEKPTGS